MGEDSGGALPEIDRSALQVSRTDGEVDPVEVSTSNGYALTFTPLTWADNKRYEIDRRSILDLSDEEKADLISRHVIRLEVPKLGVVTDWDDVGEEEFEHWGWELLNDICATIGIYSKSAFRGRLDAFRSEGKAGAAPEDDPEEGAVGPPPRSRDGSTAGDTATPETQASTT